MNRHSKLPTSLVLACLWFLLGNCYFNPLVQPLVNPGVEEEPESAGAGFIAALATPAIPPSPYFFLVSSSPADGQDIPNTLTQFSFTFSEELENNASNGSAWISENIIQNESINFDTTVNISDRKFDLNVNFGLYTGRTYIILFGPGIKVKSGKTLAPETKITFTCTTCGGA